MKFLKTQHRLKPVPPVVQNSSLRVHSSFRGGTGFSLWTSMSGTQSFPHSEAAR